MVTAIGCCTRRALLGAAGTCGIVGPLFASSPNEGDDAVELIRSLTGRSPVESARLRLGMPREFPTGHIVPLTLEIDSPMTQAEHVKRFDVVAPANPIVEVASFHFVPLRSEPRISTRIRLAAPQYVVALADMSDGTLLMTKRWVEVASNGCT